MESGTLDSVRRTLWAAHDPVFLLKGRSLSYPRRSVPPGFDAKKRSFLAQRWLKSGQNPLVLITDQLTGVFRKILNNRHLSEHEGLKVAPQEGEGGWVCRIFYGFGPPFKAPSAGVETVFDQGECCRGGFGHHGFPPINSLRHSGLILSNGRQQTTKSSRTGMTFKRSLEQAAPRQCRSGRRQVKTMK